MRDLHDLDKVDSRLLPLLAQWIGWQIDHRLEVDVQRNDIRNAPHLYKSIGLIPTVEATVKRLVGWESRTKEFVHNVFRSNQPERLNLWVREQNSDRDVVHTDRAALPRFRLRRQTRRRPRPGRRSVALLSHAEKRTLGHLVQDLSRWAGLDDPVNH